MVGDLVGEVDLDAGVRVGEGGERGGHEGRGIVDEVFCWVVGSVNVSTKARRGVRWEYVPDIFARSDS